MDRGNFINALPLVAAVVNALWSVGRFQRPIGVGRPRCPPNLHIPFIVPVGRILPMIFPAAFPIRDTLSILVQIVCLAALCAPLSIFFQRPERQYDMDMRVSGSLVFSKIFLRFSSCRISYRTSSRSSFGVWAVFFSFISCTSFLWKRS